MSEANMVHRPMRSADVPLRDAVYRVHEWGPDDVDPLIVLHGWGDCGATFQLLVNHLPEHTRVIAPDWRGFGESSRNPASYWYPDYLADLDALLALYSPDTPATLIGHSMGGNVAGLYAGAMPERVSAFINIEGFGLRSRDPDEAPERYRDWLSRLGEEPGFRQFTSMEALAGHLRAQNPHMTPEAATFVARCWAREAEDGARILADPRHKLPNPVLYRREEAEACWRRITARTLLVVGAESRLYPADSPIRLEATRLGIAGAEVASVADAGHMIHFEAPAELARLITEFLHL